ncbi:Translation initiation factor eIF-2B subunit gamma [Tieghemiomyces parasiticus]|uniref:Translation initiation factor eIF2B subunit gamma n=1 Tax=Tieghemiomyces parasiticus TaxID=78921 RepID=A0A9W8DMZ0_9FUNG|nr:Translation initiation factor eIF-2B subunit gamma [Tieghemiomyces parasiticus]
MFTLDQTHAVKSQIVPEFQAVILAGNKGSLYPLTADDNLPKALLPIANRPMIAYTLQWLELAGVRDVIVAVCPSSETQLTHYLRTVYEGPASIEIATVDEHLGTAEVLRHLANRIFHDFIVLTCDGVFALPTSTPQVLLDAHRSANPTLTALFYEPPKSEGGGGSTKDSEWPLYVGHDPVASRLLYLKAGDRVKEHLHLRTDLLRRFPRLRLTTHLQDGHIYICKRWVLDWMVAAAATESQSATGSPALARGKSGKSASLVSFSRDVLPLLIKAQYRPHVCEAAGLDRAYEAAASAATIRHKATASVAAWTTVRGVDPWDHQLRVNLFVAPQGFLGRAASISHYCDLNKHVSKLQTDTPRVDPSADVHARSQVGADSVVGKETKIDERSSVKKSVIGAHCVIGKNAKIVNSVLMDYITVEDGVKLDGCVICNNVKLQTKAQLKDCEVGAGLVVDSETQAKNERIVSSFVDNDEDSMQINFG